MQRLEEIVDDINKYISIYNHNLELLSRTDKLSKCIIEGGVFDILDSLSDKINIIENINTILFRDDEFLKYKLTSFKYNEYKKTIIELQSITQDILRKCGIMFLFIKDVNGDQLELLREDYENSARSQLGIEYFAHVIKNNNDMDKMILLKRDILEVSDVRSPLSIHISQKIFQQIIPSYILDYNTKPKMILLPNTTKVLSYNVDKLLQHSTYNKKSGLCAGLIENLNSIYITNKSEEANDLVAGEYTYDNVKSFTLENIEYGIEPSIVEFNELQDTFIIPKIGEGTKIPEFDNRILIPKSQIITKLIFYFERELVQLKKEDNIGKALSVLLKNTNTMSSFIGRTFYDIQSSYYKLQSKVSRQVYHMHYAKILENVLLFSTIFKQNVYLTSENLDKYRQIFTDKLPAEIKLTYY